MAEAGSPRSRVLRDRLLDAAEASFESNGIDAVSVEDIASLAGVSRGFVYKHFGSRDALTLAVLVRRARSFNDGAASVLRRQRTLASAIVTGILLAVDLAHRDPCFGRLVGSAVMDPTNRIDGAPEAALALSDELWRPVLESGRVNGELREHVRIDDAIHWMMYVELSLLASRSTFGVDERTHERQLRSLLVPALINASPRPPACRPSTSNDQEVHRVNRVRSR